MEKWFFHKEKNVSAQSNVIQCCAEIHMTEQNTNRQKQIGWGRLALEILPELWHFSFHTSLLVAAAAWIIKKSAEIITGRNVIITTANLTDLFTRWEGYVLLLSGVLLVLAYTSMELFASFYFADDLLNGRQGGRYTGVLASVKKGVFALKRFMTISGIPVLLFILFVIPLIGIGFTVSLTSTYYIPNFIMDVVLSTPLYLLIYLVLVIAAVLICLRHIFVLPAILIDGLDPKKAMQRSNELIRTHWKDFFPKMLKYMLKLGLIEFSGYIVFLVVPAFLLTVAGLDLPKHYSLDILSIIETGRQLSALEQRILLNRILSVFSVLEGGYLNSVVSMLMGSLLIVRFLRFYLDYTHPQPDRLYLSRPHRYSYTVKLIRSLLVAGLIALASIPAGALFDLYLQEKTPVDIIAHRAGGTLAPENSVEGIYAAARYECYGSEIDVQRTSDGYYIINHDNDFRRLAGISKSSREMTFQEIRSLKLKDTTGRNTFVQVAAIEEMLDAAKDRIKLFIELKGDTADRKMVDDLAAMIREKDCADDIVLISLNYDVINYAETRYPEFETGLLFFGAYGDIGALNCDILIMEEETATDTRLERASDTGKKTAVWTVNSRTSMEKYLDSNVNAIITDNIELARTVQEELDDRMDYEIIRSWIGDIWN